MCGVQGGRYEQADNGVVYDCPGSDPVSGQPDGPGCDAIFNKSTCKLTAYVSSLKTLFSIFFLLPAHTRKCARACSTAHPNLHDATAATERRADINGHDGIVGSRRARRRYQPK